MYVLQKHTLSILNTSTTKTQSSIMYSYTLVLLEYKRSRTGRVEDRRQSSHQEQNSLTLDGRTVLERKSGATCHRDKNNGGPSSHYH
jgi:hypothetical protein